MHILRFTNRWICMLIFSTKSLSVSIYTEHRKQKSGKKKKKRNTVYARAINESKQNKREDMIEVKFSDVWWSPEPSTNIRW